MAKQIVKVELSKGGSTHEHIEWVTWVERGTVRELCSQVAARIHEDEAFFYLRPDGTRGEIETYGADLIRTKSNPGERDGLLLLAAGIDSSR